MEELSGAWVVAEAEEDCHIQEPLYTSRDVWRKSLVLLKGRLQGVVAKSSRCPRHCGMRWSGKDPGVCFALSGLFLPPRKPEAVPRVPGSPERGLQEGWASFCLTLVQSQASIAEL